MEESSPVILEESSPPIPDESALLLSPPIHFFDFVSSLQDRYYLSNIVDFLPFNSILPPLEKDTNITFAWPTPKVYSMKYSHCFD